jgi:hypothetical protein
MVPALTMYLDPHAVMHKVATGLPTEAEAEIDSARAIMKKLSLEIPDHIQRTSGSPTL